MAGSIREEEIMRYVPAGAVAAGALLSFFITVVAGVELFALAGVALLGAAIVMAVKATPSLNKADEPAPVATVPVSDSVRADRLQQYLSQDIAVSRGRIESVAPYSAVVVTGQRVNHVLHLLVSVLLCGLWLPVWLLISVGGGEKRHVLTVDQFGNVSRR